MDARDSVASLAGALRSDPAVGAALLFGSAARGQLRPDSDLDVALRWVDAGAREHAQRDLLAWLGRLILEAGRQVHVLDLATADPAVVRRVLVEGKALFDHDPCATRRLLARRLLEYFDWEYARSVVDAGLCQALRVGHG